MNEATVAKILNKTADFRKKKNGELWFELWEWTYWPQNYL